MAAPLPGVVASAADAAGASQPLDWQSWHAGNDIRNTASLQRGARNFVNYCLSCHSLKYLRYSRMAADLGIPEAELRANLIPSGDKPTDYMLTTLSPADGEAWFGKAPPDLSLIARARGVDYLYRFLKTFYADPATASGSNNLQLASAAMPAVLSSLEGVKRAVFTSHESQVDGQAVVEKVFADFEMVAPGTLTAEQFDGFVRDTVNFLDYAGEPIQTTRVDIGIWVVLFLLAFTWLAWLLKKEYWKDVH
ncbi:MAG: cytochrome c1 [Gammaproteobacteria bacterium]|nr:cytochrome c1 [Gammaproteobacteria bacterium]